MSSIIDRTVSDRGPRVFEIVDDEPKTVAERIAIEAKENGCICQICADAGVECEAIARPDHDECDACAGGYHPNLGRSRGGRS